MDTLLRVITIIEQHPEIFTRLLDLFSKALEHNPALITTMLEKFGPPSAKAGIIHWGDGPGQQPPSSVA